MATPMNHLDLAILWTLYYADVFSYPMSADEIHHYLINAGAEKSTIEQHLQSPSQQLNAHITSYQYEDKTWYAIRDNAEQAFHVRSARDKASQKLWPKAISYGQLLGQLPFVRMVAITGSLSVHNAASEDDDLDYILVTKTGRVWLARLFAVILVRWVKLRGTELCPNYVLSLDALEQTKKDTFTAHEIAQMYPVFGQNIYNEMRSQNDWTHFFLPNASTPLGQSKKHQPKVVPQRMKRVIEWILGGKIGQWLENWEKRRKIDKFQKQVNQNSAALLDDNHVKGHFEDYGWRIMEHFFQRLDEHELPHPPITMADVLQQRDSAAD